MKEKQRATSGICKCRKTWKYYPIIKGSGGERASVPDMVFRRGDIYSFEYKPDEDGCWLYYLYRNGERELCNWSFFDEHFKVVKRKKN